jgi:hypothetical protein
MKTEKRQKQEHMLIYVCGLDQETLDKMSDTEVNKMYQRQLSMM